MMKKLQYIQPKVETIALVGTASLMDTLLGSGTAPEPKAAPMRHAPEF